LSVEAVTQDRIWLLETLVAVSPLGRRRLRVGAGARGAERNSCITQPPLPLSEAVRT